MRTPASLYAPSSRPLPSRLPEPDYPGHFQVRLVSKSTCSASTTADLYRQALVDESTSAWKKTGDGIWSVYFYDVLLGRLDERVTKSGVEYSHEVLPMSPVTSVTYLSDSYMAFGYCCVPL